MMFRKKLALIAAVIMSAGMISAVPAEVFAANSASSSASSAQTDEKAQMQKALTLFKSKITIPEEYTEFSYSTSERYSMPSFRFRWSKKNSNLCCTGTVTGGLITEFSMPYNHIEYPAFSPYSAEELQNKAIAWINKINPETKGHLEVSMEPGLSLKSSLVNINFIRTESGAPLSKNTVRVSVDKMTGEVVSYSCNWWQNAEFPDITKAVGQERIQEIYRSEVDIKPWYRMKYDYKTKKTTAQIVYVPLNNYVYDALTGKHTSMQDDYNKYMNTDIYGDDVVDDVIEEEMAAAGDAMDGEGGVIFTDEELSALQEQKDLLTEKEFRDILYKDPYIGLTKKFITESYSVTSDSNAESGYSVSASFRLNNDKEYRNYYVSADAKTGKIFSFNSYSDKNSSEILNVKDANKLAEEAAKYYYGDVFGSYKADTENTAPAVKSEKYTETSRTIRYYRYENNIQVEGNSISVGVNSAGEVTSISCRHTKNVDFSDGKVLPKSSVYDKLFTQTEFDLYYDGFTDLKSQPHTYLNYRLDVWTVNAKTGELCNYYGDPLTEWKPTPTLCPYTDIKDSPYKDEIITLYNHGVRNFSDEAFMPKKAMTVEETALFFNRLGNSAATVSKAEAKKPSTRLTLAKQLVQIMGYSKSAQLKGIYKSPYKDISDSNADISYIAINYALGIMPDDGSGNFNGSGYISREYAMHCMYQYIVRTSAESAKSAADQPVPMNSYMGGEPIEDEIVDVVEEMIMEE